MVAAHRTLLPDQSCTAEALPNLKDPDEYVQKNVATLIREVAKHSPELAQLIVNSGGVAAVVDFITEDEFAAVPPNRRPDEAYNRKGRRLS